MNLDLLSICSYNTLALISLRQEISMNDNTLTYDCGNVYTQFNTEGKFACASKKFLNGNGSSYKITKTSVDYGIATAEILSIVPESFSLLFSIFKSIKTVLFEGWGISRRITKISVYYQKESQSQKKFNKWDRRVTKFLNIECLTNESLQKLKAKYDEKLAEIGSNPSGSQNAAFRQDKWKMYLDDIHHALNGSEESNLALVSKIKTKSQNKTAQYNENINNCQFQIKKNYVGVAVAVGAIAIEMISLIGLAYAGISGALAFTAIKLTSNLALYALKYCKFLWISYVKKESISTIIIRSVDHIGVAMLKSKLVSPPDYIHPSLIQGGCQSILSTISIFHRGEDYLQDRDIQAHHKNSIAKLKRKRAQLQMRCEKINSGNYQALLEIRKELVDNIAEAQFNKALFSTDTANNVNEELREEHRTLARLLSRRITKYTARLELVDRALKTNHLADAEKVSKAIIIGTEQKLRNSKSSKKLSKMKNKLEIMRTIISITEIARFVFLAFSVYLSFIGVGFNLIPALFASSLISNALYIGYFLQNKNTMEKIHKIYENWKENPQPAREPAQSIRGSR